MRRPRLDVFCCNRRCPAGRAAEDNERGECRDCAEEDPCCGECFAVFGAPYPPGDERAAYTDRHDEGLGVRLAVLDAHRERVALFAEDEAAVEAEVDPRLRGWARERALEKSRGRLDGEMCCYDF